MIRVWFDWKIYRLYFISLLLRWSWYLCERTLLTSLIIWPTCSMCKKDAYSGVILVPELVFDRIIIPFYIIHMDIFVLRVASVLSSTIILFSIYNLMIFQKLLTTPKIWKIYNLSPTALLLLLLLFIYFLFLRFVLKVFSHIFYIFNIRQRI